MTLKRSIIALFLHWNLLAFSFSQETVKAERFGNPPEIDGKLQEEIWKEQSPLTGLIQREPENGAPFSQRTEVYFGMDDLYLYVGFRCFCDPDQITAKEMARDVSLGNDDRVQIILDTYLDRRNAFWFQIGPRGSIGDAIVSENGAAFNKAWDGLWEGRAHIHDEGWDAEMAIPFKTLGFNQDNSRWGLKLIRYFMHNQETGYWPVANLNAHKFQVSDAGYLEGLEGIHQGVGLDLVPYGLTGAEYRRPEEGGAEGRGEMNSDATEPLINAGLEAYYNITPNLKAALTLNTDFAQTEVDEQQINLTRFSLFYPEKRDFFLDGANYFNFGINGDRGNPWNTRLIPFFSRRIGLDSAGSPIPVLYGGKVTGQAGRWNIGTMYMKDRRNGWKNSHFVVSRVSRNLGAQSQIGMISTFGNAREDIGNLLTGIDLRLATSTFREDKNVSLTLYGLKSWYRSEETGWRSPGRDWAYGVEFVYPNDLLHLRMGHLGIQDNFRAGLGFVPRTGIRQSYGDFLVGPRPSRWGILQVLGGTGLDHIAGFDDRLLTREWTTTPLEVRFLTGDQISYRWTSAYEWLEFPFTIYEGHVIPEGTYRFHWHSVSLQSARRRRVWGMVELRTGGFFRGSRNEIQLKTGAQVAVPLFLGGEWVRNDVELESGGFIAYLYRLNINILFSPDITLYNYVQYDSESGEMGWQSRFQWILQPGREIFLVWNSIARDPYDRFRLEEAGARLKVKFTVRF